MYTYVYTLISVVSSSITLMVVVFFTAASVIYSINTLLKHRIGVGLHFCINGEGIQ